MDAVVFGMDEGTAPQIERLGSVEKLRGLMPGSLGDCRERPRQRIRMKGRDGNADVRGKIP